MLGLQQCTHACSHACMHMQLCSHACNHAATHATMQPCSHAHSHAATHGRISHTHVTHARHVTDERMSSTNACRARHTRHIHHTRPAQTQACTPGSHARTWPQTHAMRTDMYPHTQPHMHGRMSRTLVSQLGMHVLMALQPNRTSTDTYVAMSIDASRVEAVVPRHLGRREDPGLGQQDDARPAVPTETACWARCRTRAQPGTYVVSHARTHARTHARMPHMQPSTQPST